MQPLIKITSDPIQIARFSQNARLVNADSVDIERRKALARHRAMQLSVSHGSVSVENLSKINRTFSNRSVQASVASQTPDQALQQKMRQAQASVQMSVAPAKSQTPVSNMVPASAETDTAAQTVAAQVVASSVSKEEVAVQNNSSYTAQRGAFEMRVAKGELTYLPPLMMTIITQRPQVHVEYLGGYNYVPPLDSNSGGNINLFT